jgi:hypothetical protein
MPSISLAYRLHRRVILVTVVPLALGSNSVSLNELRTGRKTSCFEYTERARPRGASAALPSVGSLHVDAVTEWVKYRL